MPKSIFRKLKDYIQVEDTGCTMIFGNLRSTDCAYAYDGKVYMPNGIYDNSKEFLLDYYVVGIFPKYKVEDNQIKPFLYVVLRKDIKDIL